MIYIKFVKISTMADSREFLDAAILLLVSLKLKRYFIYKFAIFNFRSNCSYTFPSELHSLLFISLFFLVNTKPLNCLLFSAREFSRRKGNKSNRSPKS